MADSSLCHLESRSLLSIGGPEASDFLGRMITQRPEAARPDRAAYGALLTPQGKVISDFLILATEDGGFLLDAPKAAIGDLAKRFNMFKLRAAVTVAPSPLAVFAGWGEVPAGRAVVADPRHPDLGWRLTAAADSLAGAAPEAVWQRHRIALGIPEAGTDLPLFDAFPHDLAMDTLNGIDFDKGCYVGQEIVSRMRHRGTARRRPVVLTAPAGLPAAGADVLIGGRVAGHLGSASGGTGIAILRLDRVADAIRAGEAVTVDGTTVSVALPTWADYGWPDQSNPDT